jgi:adhesin transport system outer membrane protein
MALVSGALVVGGSIAQGETLNEAVSEVLSTNPEIQTVSYNRMAREQEVKQAFSGYLPKVDFTGGIGTYDIQEPDADPDNFTPKEMTLSLRQNVFTGMATMNEVDRQEARVRSAGYSLQTTADSIALKTARAYLDVLRNQELHNLAQENLLSHQRIADQISLRSDSGVASQADKDQVRGRVSLAQSNVVVTKTNLIDSQSNYLSVVGHLPGELQQPAVADDSMPTSMDEAEQMAVAGHPALKAAEADLEARREQHSVAKSPFLPVVDIEVDQNWDKDVDGIEGRQENLTAMIRLRYNLFHGFKDNARKNETALLINEAQEIKNNTNRQVVESIRLSWMAYQAVVERLDYLRQHVQSSSATADAYKKQFDLGKRTLLDVLDTEAELINAKKDMVNATYDGLYAQYRILNGIGTLVPSMGLPWPEGSEDQQPVQVAQTEEEPAAAE